MVRVRLVPNPNASAGEAEEIEIPGGLSLFAKDDWLYVMRGRADNVAIFERSRVISAVIEQ